MTAFATYTWVKAMLGKEGCDGKDGADNRFVASVGDARCRGGRLWLLDDRHNRDNGSPDDDEQRSDDPVHRGSGHYHR